MKEKRKRRRGIVVLCLLLVLSILTAIAVSIVSYGNRDEKRPCDVAIVLGAGTWEGQLSAVYRERLNHGIRLWEEGYVAYLIFTGGFGEGNSVSDAAAAKAYAVSQGVPENVIFIEEKSTITEENISESKKIMVEQGWETALVVSDPLHMKRAMLMAKDHGIMAYSSPTPTTMYRSMKTKLPFLAREEFFYIGYAVVRLFR